MPVSADRVAAEVHETAARHFGWARLLGAHGSVAVIVVPFAWNATARRLHSAGASLVRRTTPRDSRSSPMTAHYILTVRFERSTNVTVTSLSVDM